MQKSILLARIASVGFATSGFATVCGDWAIGTSAKLSAALFPAASGLNGRKEVLDRPGLGHRKEKIFRTKGRDVSEAQIDLTF